MFTVYGHKNVSILDGGFKKWLEEGRKVESCESAGEESDYEYKLVDSKYRNLAQMKELVI